MEREEEKKKKKIGRNSIRSTESKILLRDTNPILGRGKAFPADLSAYFRRACEGGRHGGDDRKEEESRLTPRIHGLLNFSAGRRAWNGEYLRR